MAAMATRVPNVFILFNRIEQNEWTRCVIMLTVYTVWLLYLNRSRFVFLVVLFSGRSWDQGNEIDHAFVPYIVSTFCLAIDT